MTNIELPRDAEGREIPLDTKVLYDGDGNAKEVQAFDYSPVESMWRVLLLGDFMLFLTYDMHLTPPDSWEKLEEDLDRCVAKGTACMYFSKDGICQSCSIRGITTGCSPKVIEDIVSRIRKLRGECDA